MTEEGYMSGKYIASLKIWVRCFQVNSLDRSWKKPPGQKARLVDSRSRAGLC